MLRLTALQLQDAAEAARCVGLMERARDVAKDITHRVYVEIEEKTKGDPMGVGVPLDVTHDRASIRAQLSEKLDMNYKFLRDLGIELIP